MPRAALLGQAGLAALVFGGVLFASGARADPEAVDLRVAAPPACLDAAGFLDQVRSLTDRLTPSPPDAGVRRFTVTVTPVGRKVVGTLEIEEPPARPTRRTIDGATCEEVSAVLARIVALVVDPTGAGAPPTPEDTPAEPPPDAAPPPDSTPAPALPAPLPPPPPASPAPDSDLAPLAVSVGATALTYIGANDPAAYGFGAFIDFRLPASRSDFFRPSVRVGVASITEHAEFRNADLLEVRADLTWYLVRADLCPTQADLGAHFVFVPCVALDLGSFEASGSGSAPWGAGGVDARLAWLPVSQLAVEAAFSGLVPFDAYRIETPELEEVHDMASFAVQGSVGLAYELP
jgi:hypothetical protein